MITETIETEPIINKPFIDAVDALWGKIQETHPEIPAADLRIAPGRKAGRKLAHWGLGGWNELALYPGLLAMEASSIAGVIVHEATHALSEVREIKDAASQGRHHNAKFMQLAAEMGLCLKNERPVQMGADALTVHALAWYADEIAGLDSALT